MSRNIGWITHGISFPRLGPQSIIPMPNPCTGGDSLAKSVPLWELKREVSYLTVSESERNDIFSFQQVGK